MLGFLLDEGRLLHANAFHHQVAIEDFALARPRIEKVEGTPSLVKRLPQAK